MEEYFDTVRLTLQGETLNEWILMNGGWVSILLENVGTIDVQLSLPNLTRNSFCHIYYKN